MRAHDWSASPLGPPENWPPSLRTVVGLLLQSRFPMFVAWGRDLGFLYNDFNNLLAVFASGLQLLERTAGRPAPPRVFEAMRRAVARGTGLTRHLLAFSRRRPVNPESIDLVNHLRGMRSMLDGSLGGHIEVLMNFSPDVWPVEVDAGEMELAILNLCLNSRDAMADGGVITISADNVLVDGDDGTARDFVRLSVADTGHGMPPEGQARVFELESTVGAGTVVTVLLPRSLRDPIGVARMADAASPSPRPDGERRGGAGRAGGRPPDRLRDVGHHDARRVSGLQLGREIRRRHPDLPILLTTGYVEAAAGMEDGEFNLLPKPFSLEALAEAPGVDVTQDARQQIG